MATDTPTDLIVPERARIVDSGVRAWQIRHRQQDPTRPIKVGPKTLPWVIINVVADLLLPLYADAVVVARQWLVRNTFGDNLARLAAEKGLDGFRPATGVAGNVVATSIATGGATIQEDDVLLHVPTGLRFSVVATKVYQDGDSIAIQGIDTGPSTNLPAGTKLLFVNPRAGCSAEAEVQPQNDGAGGTLGLFGGHDAETDVELQNRIIDYQSNPPAAGNSAEIVREAEKTFGVPVEKAFVVPAWYGPGTASVFFTIRPDVSSGTRIPNGVQRGLVEATLQSVFPTDYALTVAQVVGLPTTVVLGVSWKKGSKGWVDAVPWPMISTTSTAGIKVVVASSPVPTNTTVRLTNSWPNNPPSSIPATVNAPAIGQTIAFYDLSSGTFKRKRILDVVEVVADKTWDLTFDTTNGASDSYVPVAGQLASPWSNAMNLIPPAVIGAMRALGPGEQFSNFLDPGLRQRRWPPSPDVWPSQLTKVGVGGAVKATGAVADVDPILPQMPYATPVGIPGVKVNLLQLGDLALYPQEIA